MLSDMTCTCLHRQLAQYETALRRLIERLLVRTGLNTPNEKALLAVATQHENDLYWMYRGHISAIKRTLRPDVKPLVLG